MGITPSSGSWACRRVWGGAWTSRRAVERERQFDITAPAVNGVATVANQRAWLSSGSEAGEHDPNDAVDVVGGAIGLVAERLKFIGAAVLEFLKACGEKLQRICHVPVTHERRRAQ